MGSFQYTLTVTGLPTEDFVASESTEWHSKDELQVLLLSLVANLLDASDLVEGSCFAAELVEALKAKTEHHLGTRCSTDEHS